MLCRRPRRAEQGWPGIAADNGEQLWKPSLTQIGEVLRGLCLNQPPTGQRADSAGVLQARRDAVDGQQQEPFEPGPLGGVVRGWTA